MRASQPADQQSGIALAGFAHGVVAAVEVLALFELVLQEVFLVGQLAVEAEELLLFFRELLFVLCQLCGGYARGTAEN